MKDTVARKYRTDEPRMECKMNDVKNSRKLKKKQVQKVGQKVLEEDLVQK